MGLNDAEVNSIMNILHPWFVVKAVWEASVSVKEEVAKTTKSQVQLSEIKRLDPIQCAQAWALRAREEGMQYDAVIGTYLQEYRGEATGTQIISDLEENVIRIMPAQTEACQAKLAYHWQNFKVAESGVPLKYITNVSWLYGTKPRDGSNALWALIQTVTPEKRQFCVQHLREEYQGRPAAPEESQSEGPGHRVP